MVEYRDIPSQTLGAAGLSIDLGPGGVSGTRDGVFVIIVERAGVPFTVQVADKDNNYEAPAVIAAKGYYQAKKRPNLRFINITNAVGATVVGKVTDFEVEPGAFIPGA